MSNSESGQIAIDVMANGTQNVEGESVEGATYLISPLLKKHDFVEIRLAK